MFPLIILDDSIPNYLIEKIINIRLFNKFKITFMLH